MNEFYPTLFDEFQIYFLDSLRKLRSDIQYRGRDVADDYLKRSHSIIEKIFVTLLKLVEKELNL